MSFFTGSQQQSLLLVVIIVPLVLLIIIIIILTMFCIFWRRRKHRSQLSEKKIKARLENFKQRKLEIQRELSIATISTEVGDYEERYIM